ncbi:ATP-binding protein [Shewanella psychromarinicola]|uniref:histidine kinase n=1 Tax=Shewanella psychromarinicola TaxID=2487742 RepID=A0A3N4EAC9_9GAMM|nr:ATP-binding protein [Shewanella psychromarinicola]AZG35456.1 ATPase [Shewanella psychromarinicola]MCL1084113.1 ATP-binding protein [Shewanella psychromarinicola]RPA31190.1 ATPase [Shewanella psychromarinicola]
MQVDQIEIEGLRLKVEQLTEQLMQYEKLASLGQLTAGVAHEINNPIGYVASNLVSLNEYTGNLMMLVQQISELLPIDQAHNLKQQYDFEYIKQDLPTLLAQSGDGLNRVIEIISDLKDFSHLDDAEFIEIDLHLGIHSTLNLIDNELKYRAEVQKVFSDLPLVRCVPSQVNQVLLNLLLNAAQASDTRGIITINTGSDEHWVWFSVKDNGSGIPQNKLEQIFQPFYTTKAKDQGMGLGLALSRKIIDKHLGVLEVISEPGIGSCFTVKLPIGNVSQHVIDDAT